MKIGGEEVDCDSPITKLEREAGEGSAGLNIVPLLWKSGQSLTAGQE